MNKSQELNESMIKSALKDGLITAKEARQMLMVYIKRSDFSPSQSKFTNSHDIRKTHLPHQQE